MTDHERQMLIEADFRSKENEHRLDKLEEDNKAIYKIATSVEVMAEKLGNIEFKIEETSRKVDETVLAQREAEEHFLHKINDLENQPNKQLASNYDKIKVAVATSIVSFIATGIFAAIIQFGMR